MAVTTMVGARIHRREDPRLVSGQGRYVDDFVRPNTAYMAVVRSPHPHAAIRSIDSAEALAAPGVAAVFTGADFEKVIAGSMPAAPAFVAEKRQIPDHFPIARGEACYQGEPVAVVIADSRGRAVDAAQQVHVEYEPLPVVGDIMKALEPGTPPAHSGAADNICWDMTYIENADEAFAEAEVTVKLRIHQQRLAPTPMEPRGVMAEWAPADQTMMMWISSQNPHFIRLFVGGAMGIPENRFRVLSPDVGGGFGSKISPYAEDYLVPAASKLLKGRPVKFIETRTESIQTTTHGRGQVFDVEACARRDGTLLGMRVTQYLDVGAYVGTFSAFQAVACLVAGGAYNWRQIAARTVGILSNRVPTDPYRGAGRPEATHMVERVVDTIAAEIGMDPVEIRRKNFIKEFPYTNPFGLVYDSGDYDKSLNRAVEIAGYDGLRREQEELRRKGRYVGIGVSTWIELCGFGPSAATAPATGGLALTESAHVRVHPTGSVSVYVGTHSHGQGHDTTFTQVVADALGVPYDSVELRHGDTAEGPAFGYGTYGSRSLAVGGMAIYRSCQKVVEKARKLAAHLFEAADEDIVYDQGQFYVKGNPEDRKGFGEVAFAAYGMNLPEGMELGLEAVSYFDPPNLVWPFGAHICMLEVDPETGGVELRKYVAVDDCGNIINPMIVEGQLHGGIVQGIAQALFEEVVYDADGALKTGTMLDYMVPTANEIPVLDIDSTVTPTPVNDLGVKGIGEAGTIASSAAVINAIVDALRPLGVTHVDMPASPDRLWAQIRQARAAGGTPPPPQTPAGPQGSDRAVFKGETGQAPFPGSVDPTAPPDDPLREKEAQS